MTRDLGLAPLHRCLAVWVLASAVLVVLGGWLLPDLTGAAAATAQGQHLHFEQALVWTCEVVLLGCAAWLWLVTAIVATDAARGRALRRPGVPAGLHRLVLLGCGAALATTMANPAHADPGPVSADRSATTAVVQGLPLPDRATAAGHVGLLLARQVRAARHPQSRSEPVAVVRPGDTLWGLAAADLPAGADDGAVTRRWQEIYRANRQLIGPDPDLIQPAQRLRLPRQ